MPDVRLKRESGAGASWGGKWFAPDADGCITVPEAALPELTRPIHGFCVVKESPAPDSAANVSRFTKPAKATRA